VTTDAIELPDLPATPLGATAFTVLDLETTGGAPPEHKITEIAAYRIEALQVGAEFTTLVDPERSIPAFITGLTGISNAMVTGHPLSREVLPLLLDFIGDSVVVAHHSQFDRRFLDNELGLAGLPSLRNTDLCTSRLARRILPWLPSKSLGNLSAFFGISIPHRHRAAADALATCQLLLVFLNYLHSRGLDTLEQVLLFQYGDAEYEEQ
jgi:DNA polymerase III epsilon subunit family exonuclease